MAMQFNSTDLRIDFNATIRFGAVELSRATLQQPNHRSARVGVYVVLPTSRRRRGRARILSASDVERIETVADRLSTANNQNLVTFLGYSLEPMHRPRVSPRRSRMPDHYIRGYLVFEIHEEPKYRNSFDWLRECMDSDYDVDPRASLIPRIVTAFRLDDTNEFLVHQAISCDSILVDTEDRDKTLKFIDLSYLSLLLKDEEGAVQHDLIFLLGSIIFELWTLRRLADLPGCDPSNPLPTVTRLILTRPIWRDLLRIPERLREIISRCWAPNPENQPSPEELNQLLRDWQKAYLHSDDPNVDRNELTEEEREGEGEDNPNRLVELESRAMEAERQAADMEIRLTEQVQQYSALWADFSDQRQQFDAILEEQIAQSAMEIDTLRARLRRLTARLTEVEESEETEQLRKTIDELKVKAEERRQEIERNRFDQLERNQELSNQLDQQAIRLSSSRRELEIREQRITSLEATLKELRDSTHSDAPDAEARLRVHVKTIRELQDQVNELDSLRETMREELVTRFTNEMLTMQKQAKERLEEERKLRGTIERELTNVRTSLKDVTASREEQFRELELLRSADRDEKTNAPNDILSPRLEKTKQELLSQIFSRESMASSDSPILHEEAESVLLSFGAAGVWEERDFDCVIRVKTPTEDGMVRLSFLRYQVPESLEDYVRSEGEEVMGEGPRYTLSLESILGQLNVQNDVFVALLTGRMTDEDLSIQDEFRANLFDYYFLFSFLELPVHAYLICRYLIGNVDSLRDLLYYLRLSLSATEIDRFLLKDRLLRVLRTEGLLQEDDDPMDDLGDSLSVVYGEEENDAFVVACLNAIIRRWDGSAEIVDLANFLLLDRLIRDHQPRSLLSSFEGVAKTLKTYQDDDLPLSFDILGKILLEKLYEERRLVSLPQSVLLYSSDRENGVAVHRPVLRCFESKFFATEFTRDPNTREIALPGLPDLAIELLVDFIYGKPPRNLNKTHLSSLFSLVRFFDQYEEDWVPSFIRATQDVVEDLQSGPLDLDIMASARVLFEPECHDRLFEALQEVLSTGTILGMFRQPANLDRCDEEEEFFEVLDLDRLDYDTRDELGFGAYGTVCRGTLRAGNEGKISLPVAVKFTRIGNRITEDVVKHEASIMSKIQHESCLKCYGYFFADAELRRRDVPHGFIVLELCDAEMNVLKYVMEHDLNDLEKLRIIIQIAEGVEHLHSIDVIHRDLKPENILMLEDRVKISDYGVSRIRLEAAGTQVGTYPYMLISPHGPRFEEGRDIYAFALLAFQLWVERPIKKIWPFIELGIGEKCVAEMSKDKKNPIRPNLAETTMPKELQDLIAKCCVAFLPSFHGGALHLQAEEELNGLRGKSKHAIGLLSDPVDVNPSSLLEELDSPEEFDPEIGVESVYSVEETKATVRSSDFRKAHTHYVEEGFDGLKEMLNSLKDFLNRHVARMIKIELEKEYFQEEEEEGEGFQEEEENPYLNFDEQTILTHLIFSLEPEEGESEYLPDSCLVVALEMILRLLELHVIRKGLLGDMRISEQLERVLHNIDSRVNSVDAVVRSLDQNPLGRSDRRNRLRQIAHQLHSIKMAVSQMDAYNGANQMKLAPFLQMGIGIIRIAVGAATQSVGEAVFGVKDVLISGVVAISENTAFFREKFGRQNWFMVIAELRRLYYGMLAVPRRQDLQPIAQSLMGQFRNLVIRVILDVKHKGGKRKIPPAFAYSLLVIITDLQQCEGGFRCYRDGAMNLLRMMRDDSAMGLRGFQVKRKLLDKITMLFSKAGRVVEYFNFEGVYEQLGVVVETLTELGNSDREGN